jgi:DNA-binding transcriptional LysR family regulator
VNTLIHPNWQLFVKVADAGSLSGAALALAQPISVVSRGIAQIERDLGARLFRRTGRGVVLTEFGKQVYPRVLGFIQDTEQFADDMRSQSGVPMGDVRLGMLTFSVPKLAGPLFVQVRQRWPRVRLHLSEGSSAQLEEGLAQGRLDMATLLREEDEVHASETPLLRTPLALVVPASHALAQRQSIPFDELATLPLVLPGAPHPLRTRLQVLARQRQLTLTCAIEADSIRLQHEMVAAGGGFAITAAAMAPPHAGSLALVRIVQPALSRTIVLGIAAHRPHTLATRSVADLIRSWAPDLLHKES